jgi:hypothetical protein
MAAADIYVRPTVSAGEDPWVVVSAQNRGTEALYGVRLDVVVDGIPARRTYYNVGVGATVSHEFRVSTRRLAQGGIPVSFTAAIEGGGDANPDNDTRHGRIHVGGTEVLQKTAAARS